MKSRDFCYWLQGFFELSGREVEVPIDGAQIGIIKNHLAMVFKHEIDPSNGTHEHNDALSKIHRGLVDSVTNC